MVTDGATRRAPKAAFILPAAFMVLAFVLLASYEAHPREQLFFLIYATFPIAILGEMAIDTFFMAGKMSVEQQWLVFASLGVVQYCLIGYSLGRLGGASRYVTESVVGTKASSAAKA